MGKPKRIWILAFLLITSVTLVRAQTPEEQTILDGINTARAEQGLKLLRWDPALAAAAQAHADRMVKEKTLSHQYAGEPSLPSRAAQQGARFQVIAENIAMNVSPEAAVKGWLKSPPHRANIFNTKLSSIGVGVAKRGNYYFAVADFSDAVAALTRAQVEQKIGDLLLKQGVRPTGPTRDAQQTCEMPSGTAGGSSPRAVIRWESPNLNSLPAPLEAQIRTGQFHTAAVGACDSLHPESNFATYRIAVLLY